MILKGVAQYLENAASGILTIGTNLFVGFFPDDAPNTCSALLLRGGPPDYMVQTRWVLMIQVLTRAVDFYAAEASAELIYNTLFIKGGMDLPQIVTGENYYVLACLPVARPQHVGKDEKNRHQFSTSFKMEIKET